MATGVSVSAGTDSTVEADSASSAGANVVVHSSAEESCCPSSSRRFQIHCARIWANRLSARGMRVPPICVLLVVFIRQHRLKRATMQVEVKHIRGSKCRGGKRADKQFVDAAVSLDANFWGRGGGRVGSDHQTDLGSGWRQGNGRTSVEGPRHPTFRMAAYMSRGAGKCLLDGFQIQQMVGTTRCAMTPR